MDRFQSELLAQLKEHNRLTKEIVKLQRAAINEPKKINTEIFSAVKVRPAHWISHREHCENLGVMPSGLGSYVWCSNCDCGIDITEWQRNPYNYCPNCGMEMEKEGEDNA